MRITEKKVIVLKVKKKKIGRKISIIPIHHHPLLLEDPAAKGHRRDSVISQPWRVLTEM